MRVIINGAGIAGPTLAYWLQKSGHDVLLVEAAPQLRRGGYVIDFWGVGYDVAERMGIIPQLRQIGYQVEEVRFVNRNGRKSGGFSLEGFGRLLNGRFTTLRRADLATAIYEAIDGSVETLFNDSVAGHEESEHNVRVSFDHAAPRDADLVIGADGLHSRVRRLAFGPDEEVEVCLGYHVAAFSVEGYRPREELVYLSHGEPGKQVSRWSMRNDQTVFLFVFRNEYLKGENPSNEQERKEVLRRVFANVGWECPHILESMTGVRDIYFDRVSQIQMDRWTKGRVGLIGDAASCVSLLAGEGAGLGMAEAYVLAGELHRCKGDHVRAFTQYEQRMAPFIKRKQKMARQFASSFAPKTALGVAFRNLVLRLMQFPFVVKLVFRRELKDEIDLPRYWE